MGKGAFNAYDGLQEGKNTSRHGYAAGKFTCKGGDEKDYVFTLEETDTATDNGRFIIKDNELILNENLVEGSYVICVKAASAGKTASLQVDLEVKAKGYKKQVVLNPYADIDWSTVNFVSTALHNHTSYSDSSFEESEHNDIASDSVTERVARYKSFGYGAVVIAEHDYVALEKEGGSYKDSSIIGIYGNELSKVHHHLYYGLSPYYDNKGSGVAHTNGIEGNALNIAKKGDGIMYFAHPFRSSTDCDYWYDIFNRHSVIYGMEVFNAGQAKRNYSEPLWDYILSRSMPERAIWGSASDDAHSNGSAGTGWQVLLLRDDEMNGQGVFNALKEGNSFLSTICVDPQTDEDIMRDDVNGPIPYFTSITVNDEEGRIYATAENYDRMEWVSLNGKVVATGSFIDLNLMHGTEKYVRCRIYGQNGMSHSQPIGIADGTELYDGNIGYVPPEDGEEPDDPSAPTPSENDKNEPSEKKGCKGAFGGESLIIMLAAVAAGGRFVKLKRRF